jgi:hypothetical protein
MIDRGEQQQRTKKAGHLPGFFVYLKSMSLQNLRLSPSFIEGI